MIEASEIVKAFLVNNPYFVAIIGADKVFPLVAPAGTVEPFTTYVINQKRPQTKESSVFEVTLLFWFKTYNAACEFHDGIKPFIEEHRKFMYQDSTVEYLEDYLSFYSLINFQIIN
jgi:hypothetical protein